MRPCRSQDSSVPGLVIMTSLLFFRILKFAYMFGSKARCSNIRDPSPREAESRKPYGLPVVSFASMRFITLIRKHGLYVSSPTMLIWRLVLYTAQQLVAYGWAPNS